MHNTVAYGFTETPPYLTVEFDKISILETLIKNGADINARTKTTETALHKVAMFDNEEAIEVVVQSSAKIDMKDKYWGTPLYVAARFNRVSKCFFEMGLH